jgi:radical SAM protein
MNHPAYTAADFDRSPLMFYYEITRACDLVCKHCRASAQQQPDAAELSTEVAQALIAQVATFPKRPMLVLTGGDPLKRADLFDLIRHAVQCGVEPVLTPSATPLATGEAFAAAKEAGVRRLGISLDGPDAETHDAFRGWEGSFVRTLRMLADARRLGMAVQVNTSVTRRNVDKLDAMAELLRDQGIAMWSVFFLVPVGRGIDEDRIPAEQYEVVFEQLYQHSHRQPYAIKTTEAPHYRRFVLQKGGDPLAGPQGREDGQVRRGHRAPLGVGDGKGVMFVGHNGEIFPAGFLPLECGRFPQASVVDVYQNHPTFRALRNPDLFRGKCGICEYRQVCGGSRARAYGVTGDPLETEPDCVYVPATGAAVIATV